MILFFCFFLATTSVSAGQQLSNDESHNTHQVKKNFEIEKDNQGNQFIVSSIQIIQSENDQHNNDNPSHVDRTIQKTHARTLQSLPSSLEQNEKRQILDARNEIRTKTAQGNMQSLLPTASNMVSKNRGVACPLKHSLLCTVHNTQDQLLWDPGIASMAHKVRTLPVPKNIELAMFNIDFSMLKFVFAMFGIFFNVEKSVFSFEIFISRICSSSQRGAFV